MDSVVTPSRPFIPGTTGWTIADLDDPETAAHWDSGRFEIVEGVLTTMPAAYYLGGRAMQKLIGIVEDYLIDHNLPGDFSPEADIVIDPARVVCADAVLLTDADNRRQEEAAAASGRSDSERIRILVPPTLIIESVGPGHELHDQCNNAPLRAFIENGGWPINPVADRAWGRSNPAREAPEGEGTSRSDKRTQALSAGAAPMPVRGRHNRRGGPAGSRVLKLIRIWLKAMIIEPGDGPDDPRKAHRSKQGAPQGEVVPLHTRP